MTNDEVLVLQADDKPKHSGDCDKEQKSSVNDDTCGVEKNSPPPSKSSSAIEIDMIDDFSEICGLGDVEGFQTAMTVRRITHIYSTIE